MWKNGIRFKTTTMDSGFRRNGEGAMAGTRNQNEAGLPASFKQLNHGLGYLIVPERRYGPLGRRQAGTEGHFIALFG